MREKIGIIFGVIIFTAIIGGMIYVNIATDEFDKMIFSEIILEGNETLSAGIYLINSDLNKVSEYSELTLQEIKARITKHPYVAKAEVQADGIGRVNINIVEKKFMAVLLIKSNPFLITENFQLIKLKMNSDISKLPVISNVNLNHKVTETEKIYDDDLVRAFKIIDAAKIVNTEMYNQLAEINLKFGRDIILTFSGIKCPIILGKDSESKKIVILSSIWKELNKEEKLFNNSSYVDLRFDNNIYIGKTVYTETNG